MYGYRNANGLDINYSDEPFITKDSVVIGSEEVAPKNIPEQKDLAKLAGGCLQIRRLRPLLLKV